MIPELGITQHVQAGQRGMAAVVMCPATAINRERGQNDPRRVSADGAIKPVFTVDHMYPTTIGHHVAGQRRPWNTAAVSLFGGKAMPRKRLEGRSLNLRVDGVK